MPKAKQRKSSRNYRVLARPRLNGTFIRGILFSLCVFAPGVLDAKLYLMLDERLRKSPIEQTIYKFVPLTNASEVELNYVRDFFKDNVWLSFATHLKKEDNGIYIGADRWPQDAAINEVVQTKAWQDNLGKIAFLVESTVPAEMRPPKGIYPRRELWKKYSELADLKYAGFFATHSLDTKPNTLTTAADWSRIACVHESGRMLSPGKASPLSIRKDSFQLNFRTRKHLDFAGSVVCVNPPKADVIFEIHTQKTDVGLEVENGRFSLWNEAQPMRVHVKSTRMIGAPLALQIVPEANQTQTEFFFQGDRVACTSGRCRKKDASFLLPQFRDFNETFEFAIRAPGDSYFRGVLRLMAGEIEVARTTVRFTPQSLVAETSYALKHPSEYQSAFLIILALVIVSIVLLVLLWRGMRKAARIIAEKNAYEMPRQTSATLAISRGVTYRMTAGENPFGCELLGFGGIVALRVHADTVWISHAGIEKNLPLADLCYQLPDGYVLEIKTPNDGSLLLEVYLLTIAAAPRRV